MASRLAVASDKAYIPVDLVNKIYSLFNINSSPSRLNKRSHSIPATLTSFDGCKTLIDLTVCRPDVRSVSRPSFHMNELEILEDLIIVWLDRNINQIEEDISKRKHHLRLIINCLKTFDNIDDCLHYIENTDEEKIFFILPGSLGRTVIKQISDYSQVLGVYIYCSNKRDHEVWTKDYPNIVGISTSESELMTQISKDAALFFQNNISFDTINSLSINEQSFEDLSQNQAKFLWSQVFMEVLLRLPPNFQSKTEVIEECRRFYTNNEYQQRQLTEFERTYTPSNALVWYTHESFFYRIVNKALRTRNICSLFKYRFIILDLFQQITKSNRHTKKQIFKLYRGQLMSANEFQRLQINNHGYICLNGFVSMTRSSCEALDFAGSGNQRPLFESVYFEIETDNDSLLCPPGTIFRIENIELLNEKIWSVKLVSIDELEFDKLERLKQIVFNEFHRFSCYLTFGHVLQTLNEHERARIYYELLLIELPVGHPDIPAIYCGLGRSIQDSKLAMKHLKESLTLQMKNFSENILLLIETFRTIARNHRQAEKWTQALNLYKFILEILNSIHVDSISKQILHIRADTCDQIGCIHSKMNNFSSALKYFKSCLSIERQILPSNHPKIAEVLNDIGMIYSKKVHSNRAEEYFRQANTIRQETLPPEFRPDRAQMHNQLGAICFQQGNFDEALVHFEKALEIQLKCLPPIHPHTAIVYKNLGNIHIELKNYPAAIQMFETSLKIGQQCWHKSHSEISQIYRQMGVTYRLQGYNDKALRYCQKALEIALKCSSSMDHCELAETYRALAKVYTVMNSHAGALIHFQKAMSIYIKNPPTEQIRLGTLYDELGRECYNEKYYQDALRCLLKALEIYQNVKLDEVSIHILYFQLGKAFYQNNDCENALIYYNRCLQFEITNPSYSTVVSLSQTYHAIGETFQKLKNYQMSLRNYAKAFDLVLNDKSSLVYTDQSRLLAQYQKSIETVKNLL